MSHNIEYFTYAENIRRDYVKRELDSYVAHADWQEGCSGLYHEIRWLDSLSVCEDEEEAKAVINDHDRRNYDNLAVRYYERTPVQDAKLTELRRKIKDCCDEYGKRNGIIYAETVTAEYIGCKTCGSKLSRVHLKSNRCPVCASDLRPLTMRKYVAAALDKWHKALAAERDYIMKHAKKKVMWLVKIEYHT